MTLSTSRPSGPPSRGRGDDGTAILELTLVAVLLFTIVFGIINFGLILSFKQDVTRAAAEGARAGAVSMPSTVFGANDPRRLAAVTATDEAVAGFKKTCGSGGLTCAVQIHDCDYAVPPADFGPTPDTNGYHEDDPSADIAGDPNEEPDCITVKLSYDYDGNPIVVAVPLIEAFLPDEINAKSVVRLNQ